MSKNIKLPAIKGLFREDAIIMDIMYISCTSDKIHKLRSKIEHAGACFLRTGVKSAPNENGLYSYAEKYIDGDGNVAYLFMLQPREEVINDTITVVYGNVEVCRGMPDGNGYYDSMFENFNTTDIVSRSLDRN